MNDVSLQRSASFQEVVISLRPTFREWLSEVIVQRRRTIPKPPSAIIQINQALVRENASAELEPERLFSFEVKVYGSNPACGPLSSVVVEGDLSSALNRAFCEAFEFDADDRTVLSFSVRACYRDLYRAIPYAYADEVRALLDIPREWKESAAYIMTPADLPPGDDEGDGDGDPELVPSSDGGGCLALAEA